MQACPGNRAACWSILQHSVRRFMMVAPGNPWCSLEKAWVDLGIIRLSEEGVIRIPLLLAASPRQWCRPLPLFVSRCDWDRQLSRLGARPHGQGAEQGGHSWVLDRCRGSPSRVSSQESRVETGGCTMAVHAGQLVGLTYFMGTYCNLV